MVLALLLKVILAIPLSILVAYAIREFMVYRQMDFFRKQGIKCIYIPVLGILSQYLQNKDSKDQMGKLKALLEKQANEPILAFNTPRYPRPSCLINDEELIKELFLKETECTIKSPLMEHLNFGFFFENGEKVQEARGIYGQFFNYQNLQVISTKIRAAIMKILSKFKNTKMEKGKWNKVLLKVLFNEIFGEIVNAILFGEEAEHLIDGEPLHIACQNYINGVLSILTKPLNVIGLDYPHKWKMLKETRDNLQLYQKLEESLWNIYQKRKEAGPVGVPNLVDLLVQHNNDKIKQGREPLSKREIAGHFILLQFAGADTSMEVTTTSLFRMAKEPRIQDLFLEVVKRVEKEFHGEITNMDYALIEKDEQLDDYIQEFLRIGAPVPLLSNRDFIKDTKIGKYQFRKGDRAFFLCSLNHTITRYFPHGDEFKPEELKKFRSKSGLKTAFIPFGQGRRICIGKALGEMLVKLVISITVRDFEVSPDPDYTEAKVFKLTYGLKEPSVLMRLRQ